MLHFKATTQSHWSICRGRRTASPARRVWVPQSDMTHICSPGQPAVETCGRSAPCVLGRMSEAQLTLNESYFSVLFRAKCFVIGWCGGLSKRFFLSPFSTKTIWYNETEPKVVKVLNWITMRLNFFWHDLKASPETLPLQDYLFSRI